MTAQPELVPRETAFTRAQNQQNLRVRPEKLAHLAKTKRHQLKIWRFLCLQG